MSIEYTYPSQYPRHAHSLAHASSAVSTPVPAAKAEEGESFFSQLLDAINPLQQLPVIGTIYRELTGDTISPASRMAGGAMFGGLVGFVVAAVNAAIEDGTGKDVGEHLVAAVKGDDATQVASAALPWADEVG